MKKISLILIGIVVLFGLFLHSDSVQAATFKAIYLRIDVNESEMYGFYGCGLNELHFLPSQSSYTEGGEVYHCPIFLTEEDDFANNDNHLIVWVHKGSTIKKESSSYLTDDIWYTICDDRSSPGCEVNTDTFNDNKGEAWKVAERPFGSITDECHYASGGCTLSVSNTEYRPAKDLYCNASGFWEEQEPAPPPPPVTCTETDTGKDWDTYGKCYENEVLKGEDLCMGEFLYERYCENNQCKFVSYTCPLGEHCLEGACVSEAEHICEDTDEDSSGQTKVWDERGSCYEDTFWKGTDECLAGSATKLKEQFCDGTECSYIIHDCSPYGCEDGKCTTEIPTCEDTDKTASGQTKVFDKYGTCYENGVFKGEDECYVDDDFLEEWYCDGTKCTHITQKCSPGICQNGECIGIPNCMRPKCEGLETGICMCGTKQIEDQYCCAASNSGYNTLALCQADSACVPSSCQCLDGTPCSGCKSDIPPLYCDAINKKLINKCSVCGCPASSPDCQPDESCKTGVPPACDNNGVKEGSEQCDGSDLGGQTCQSRGFTGGTLSCQSDCTFNTFACTGGGPGDGTGSGELSIDNPLTTENFKDIVDNLIDFIFKIAIVLAPLMIVVGAFLFLTSSGDLQKVTRAKSLMIWTVVGFIIVLLAKGLLAMLESILGVA